MNLTELKKFAENRNLTLHSLTVTSKYSKTTMYRLLSDGVALNNPLPLKQLSVEIQSLADCGIHKPKMSLNHLDNLKEEIAKSGGSLNFFSQGNMEFFKSKIYECYRGKDLWYFITSEKTSFDSNQRKFTVRKWEKGKGFDVLGLGFLGYETRSAARSACKSMMWKF